MKKELVILLGILILGISACAQDFAVNRVMKEQAQKNMMEQQIQDNKIIPQQMMPSPPSYQIPPVEANKQSEVECNKFWKKMKKDGKAVLSFTEREVRVSFSSEVSFTQALELLEKYKIEKKKITGIFMRPDDSEEQQYTYNRNIIGSVEQGTEVESACGILQEKGVYNAYPEVGLFGLTAR